MGVKQSASELLDCLPGDCGLEDVLYHLHVVWSIQKGLADAEARRVITHEEVAEALRRRWQLGAAE